MSRRPRSGFTIVEVLVSTGVLSLLLLLAAQVSRASLSSTHRTVAIDVLDARVERTFGELRPLLRSASLATLMAVDSKVGGPAQPLVDGVIYDNLEFRDVVGWANGAALLEPPLTDPPYRLWFVAGVAGRGAIWFDDGRSAWPLMDGIDGVSIAKTGKRLAVDLAFHRPDARGDVSSQLVAPIVIP